MTTHHTPEPTRAGRRRSSRNGNETRAAWIFMAPAIAVFGLFLILPLLFTVFISTSNWNGITPVAQRGELASGTIVATNVSGAEVTVPRGATVMTDRSAPEPVTFRVDDAVTLPPGGSDTVPIVANNEFIGTVGNVGPGIITQPGDGMPPGITITNPQPTSGGQNGAFDLIGLGNYQSLLVDDGISRTSFSRALLNTVYYVIIVVPIQTALAMILAIIVNQQWLRGRGFFRTAFYLPSVTSSVVISLIFMFMFSRGGIVNGFISWLSPGYAKIDWLNNSAGLLHLLFAQFGITRDAIPFADLPLGGLTLWDWIGGPSVTWSMIMVLNIWTTTGTLLVIFLAALQSIPASVYEAAALDGAKWWATLWNITIPMIRPTTFLVITIGLISTFQVFDQVFVITQGGPANTTVTIGYIVYQNAFQRGQMGLAAATAIVLFFIIFFFSIIQRRITSDKGNA